MLLAAGVLVGTLAGAEETSRFATAEEAVAARAWQDAARIWRREAAAGRAEAHLGLGNLWDLGVLGRRDPAAALAAYRKAAEAGLPAAAFNIAAMHAAGSGTGKDMHAAASWYARAALGGHDRAAFALGRLFAAGEALPANPAIAAGWLEQAAQSLPAAQAALGDLAETGAGRLHAPVPLAFRVRDMHGRRWVQAAWSAGPGPDAASFRLDVVSRDAQGQPAALAASANTRSGMATLPLPHGVADLGWRVVMIDRAAGDYAASDWFDPQLQPLTPAPVGAVRFRTAPGNLRAGAAAQTFAGAFHNAGFRVTVGTDGTAPAVSAVRYRFAADAAMARDIARFMPAIGPADVAMDPDLDAHPGEVVVELAFE